MLHCPRPVSIQMQPKNTTPYLSRIHDFAWSLQSDAERLDTDSDLLAGWYARFAAEELHLGWSTRQALSSREFCEVLALLAESSGAFAFLVLQQLVANSKLGHSLSENVPVPQIGVAFGHLRKAHGQTPRWDGNRVSGVVPWMTGAGIFEKVILGVRDENDNEIYVLAEATDCPAFRHSAPMNLVACSGTRTVSVTLSNFPIHANAILQTDPPGTLACNDSQSVLYQTPLMVGCIRACIKLVQNSAIVGQAERLRCEEITTNLLERVYSAFDTGCTPAMGRLLRAELGDFAVRLARLAVMASGGAGLLYTHPAQRLAREALLYSVMAQTPDIVTQAFQEVLR